MPDEKEDRPRDSGSRDSGSRGEPDRAPPADGSRPRRRAADESLRSDALPDSVRCPHCGETDSEQFAAFGSAVSVSQYYCRACRTVFEFMKWR